MVGGGKMLGGFFCGGQMGQGTHKGCPYGVSDERGTESGVTIGIGGWEQGTHKGCPYGVV